VVEVSVEMSIAEDRRYVYTQDELKLKDVETVDEEVQELEVAAIYCADCDLEIDLDSDLGIFIEDKVGEQIG